MVIRKWNYCRTQRFSVLEQIEDVKEGVSNTFHTHGWKELLSTYHWLVLEDEFANGLTSMRSKWC